MSCRRNISMVLADTLNDLSKQNFSKFCHRLLDRRDEPRVLRSRVEAKSRLEIVDVLVSTFTEDKAARVTEDILRDISCTQQAETLGQNRTRNQDLSKRPGSSETCRLEQTERFRIKKLRKSSQKDPRGG
uniref:Pyrin domain-containing protein n=1 Tax=Kryptolebias marmoratus TaxID=37003 RepID=A0A3Q3A860_KRYMA